MDVRNLFFLAILYFLLLPQSQVCSLHPLKAMSENIIGCAKNGIVECSNLRMVPFQNLFYLRLVNVTGMVIS